MKRPTAIRWSAALLAAAALLILSERAQGETRRLAIVVGHNQGRGPDLKYAERDAMEVRRVLLGVGQVRPEDLYHLNRPTPVQLIATLRLAQRRAKDWQDRGVRDVVVIFYYSGHANERAFELGAAELRLDSLIGVLREIPAKVHLVVVDSCHSGALPVRKGAGPAPPPLSEPLAAEGVVALTSSADDEESFENQGEHPGNQHDRHGGYFTFHLMRALAGDADGDGDGVVTLEEAFNYARQRTIADTVRLGRQGQHPQFKGEIKLEGPLVLSVLPQRGARVHLPAGYDRIILDRIDGVLVKESLSRAAVQLALAPGRYRVTAWQGNRCFEAREHRVPPGESRLYPEELSRVPSRYPWHWKKGGRPAMLVLGLGVQGSVAELPVLYSMRLGARTLNPSGWAAALDLSSGPGTGRLGTHGVETSVMAWIGYRFGFWRGAFSASGGLSAGGGVVFQHPEEGPARVGGVVMGAPWIGAAIHLWDRLYLSLEGQVGLGWVRRSARYKPDVPEDTLLVLPGGWMGLMIGL